jgi:hypothetical protein
LQIINKISNLLLHKPIFFYFFKNKFQNLTIRFVIDNKRVTQRTQGTVLLCYRENKLLPPKAFPFVWRGRGTAFAVDEV